MPGDFLDTSALAKHYHPEVGTAEMDRLWNDPGRILFVSRLSALEIVSAFAGKVRAGVISAADFDILRRRFTADLTKFKRPTGARILVRHYQEAERLLRLHGLLRRLRTLDALQLAVALDLQRMNAVDRIVSADKDLLAVAALEGLGVRPGGFGRLGPGKPVSAVANGQQDTPEDDAMKTSSISLGELRRLLLDLQFTETRGDTYWRFEHPASETVFLFRPYALSEKVAMHDIAATRTHLDWRGLLSARAFDDSLAKTPAWRQIPARRPSRPRCGTVSRPCHNA